MNIEDQKQFIIKSYDQGKSVLDIAEEIYGRDDKGQARYTDSMMLDIENMIKAASAEEAFCSPAVEGAETDSADNEQLKTQLEAQERQIQAQAEDLDAKQAQIDKLQETIAQLEAEKVEIGRRAIEEAKQAETKSEDKKSKK